MSTNIGAFARVDKKVLDELGDKITAEVRAGRFESDAVYVFGRGDPWNGGGGRNRPRPRCRLELHPYITPEHPEQTFSVVVNGTKVTQLTYQARGRKTERIVIPREVAASRGAGELLIEFLLPNAVSPSSDGQDTDTRELALGLSRFTLVRYVP